MRGWARQVAGLARRLRRGEVVAYPTEAVYGLGCDPQDRRAVMRLLGLKRRPRHKGLILIGADIDQLRPYVDWGRLTEAMRRRMAAAWPGPTTLLLPAGRRARPWLRGRHGGIAVRVTAHGPARALCRAFGGALVSTSANPAGRRPSRSRRELRRHFGRDLPCLDAPLGPAKRPSCIVDAATGEVLRA